MTQNTSKNYDEIVSKLSPSEDQKTLITWLYNEVGNKVSEELQTVNLDDPNFEVYDIVDHVIEELLEEFKTTPDFTKIEPILTNNYTALHNLLKFGYGSPEEIFKDYKDMLEG